MGLFDLLSKEGRAKSALSRHIKKVSDKFAQSPDRFVAMEKLRAIGGDEALYGLARRFAFVYDKTIEDEQEKEWVLDALTMQGEAAITPVTRYLKESKSLSYGLKILERVAKVDRLWPIIDDILKNEEPGYTRDPSRKVQMITWLGEWKAGRAEDVTKRVVPYLGDFDETVRFTAIETLAHQPHDAALGPLVDALIRPEEESRRIKVRIAELLGQVGWVVPQDNKEAVARLLEADLTDWYMHHDKLVKKGK